MHHDQSGQTARKEHHRRDEKRTCIKRPQLCREAENRLQQGKGNRTDNRPEEEANATQEGHQQDHTRGCGVQVLFGQDFIVDGEQTTRNAAEKAGRDEAIVADPPSRISQELCPFRVIADGVCHTANGCAAPQVHKCCRNHEPCDGEVVHFDLLKEFDTKERLRVSTVAADPFFAAKEGHDDNRTGRDQFTHTQRDHGEHCARRPR